MSVFWWDEAKAVLCGAMIGHGISREVYECRIDPNLVVKIETPARSFQNVAEWEAWSWVDGKRAKWLAPCKAISPCGGILLQSRVTPMRDKERPAKIPAFLTDIKPENFGFMDGRVVCIDYGTILHAVTKASTRLVRAKWRE